MAKSTGLRNIQVERILKIGNLLAQYPHGLTLEEINKLLDDADSRVSERTLRRDMQVLERIAGVVPTKISREHQPERPGYKIGIPLRHIEGISESELQALFVAELSTARFRGSPVYPDIENFFQKVKASLPAKDNRQMTEEFKNNIFFRALGPWEATIDLETFSRLYFAIAEGEVINFQYSAIGGPSAGKKLVKKIGPHCLLFYDSGVYLVGADLEDQNKVKPYSLVRISEAETIGEPYDRPDGNPLVLFESAIGLMIDGAPEEIVIEIDDPIGSLIAERSWHKSQKIERLAAGIRLTMTVLINDELINWLLGLGPKAKIISPKQVIDQVKKACSAITQRYEG